MQDKCFGHPKEGSRGLCWTWAELHADIMRHGHICLLSAHFYFWRSTSIQRSGFCHFQLGHIISHLKYFVTQLHCLRLSCRGWMIHVLFFLSVEDEFESHGESLRQKLPSMSTIQGWTSEKRRSHSFTSGTATALTTSAM